MVASIAAGRPRAGRWALAISPVAAAVALMAGFGLAAGGAAGSRAATNPAVGVPGLLTAADLGQGWTASHAGATTAEAAGCFRPRATMLASSPLSLVGVVLTGPAGLPQADEMAARYPTSTAADSAFDSVKGALNCSTYATTSGVAQVTPVRVGTPADRVAAAQAVILSGGADFIAAQKGTGLVLLVYGSAGVPDAATVDRLTAKALQRLGP